MQILKAEKASDQRARRQQEDESGADLGGDHGVADPMVPPIADRPAAGSRTTSPARVRAIAASGAAVRSAVTNAVITSDEPRDGGVEPDLSEAGDGGRRPPHRRTDRRDRGHPAEEAADRRQQQRLEPELPRELQPRRAHRDPHRQLGAPAVGPDERQRHEIRERRGQDQDHRGQEREHRRPMAGDEHLVQRDDLHRLFARVLDRKLLAQRAADRGQLRPGLAGPRAGIQPADEPQEVHRAPHVAERVAVGNERRHDVDVSQRQGKLCRQHAHDDERLSVDSHGASDGVGVAAEPVPPEAVTEDRHVRRIGAVVALLEKAARRRRGSQDLERVGRHARALEPFGGAVAREACAPIGVRREARQRARRGFGSPGTPAT